ncbi:MAG: hypothetical protein RIR45_547 [Pseudomonadota bacterium]|jgi:hypothetical protein
MAAQPNQSAKLQLARTVRERFLAELGRALGEIAGAVQARLDALIDEPASARESQFRRDAWMAYRKIRPRWVDGTIKTWRDCLDPVQEKKVAGAQIAGLELVGCDVVENKILASRIVVAVMEKVDSSFDDLRLRIRLL